MCCTGHCFSRFWHNENGASLVEYALIMALLAALAVFVLDAGRPAMRGAFERLAFSGGNAPQGDRNSLRKPDVPATAMADEEFAPQSTGGLRAWRMPLTVAAIAVSAIGLVICRGRSRESAPIAEEIQTPTVVERILDKRQRMLRFLSSNTEMVFASRLSVAHLMTPRLETVQPQAPLDELRQMTIDKGIHHLLVTDGNGLLIGVISDRDLLSRSGKTAGDIMTKEPCSVTPESPLCTALTVLLHKRISCLPIVQDGVPCGILTTTDVILALQCIIQTLEKVGAVTQGMFDEETNLEGTLQVLMRIAEAGNDPAFAHSA